MFISSMHATTKTPAASHTTGRIVQRQTSFLCGGHRFWTSSILIMKFGSRYEEYASMQFQFGGK